MNDVASRVQDNAANIVRLNNRIRETFGHRGSNYSEWSEACAEFHRQYDDLFFPGGLKHWSEFLGRAPEGLESAIVFLEVDPWFFRSGYTKQIIWSRLKKATLTAEQQRRLESVALSYLRKRVRIEFWYMVRYVRARGSDPFWDSVQERALSPSDEGTKAGWLLLARTNQPVRNWINRECLRARYESGYVPKLRFMKLGNG